MMMMSTYGLMERSGRNTSREVPVMGGAMGRVHFQYPEVIGNHFKYRHLVDDHNAKRHSPISLEVVWATKTWEKRVFAFLLAVTEVNVKLGAEYFYGMEQLSMIKFRKRFSKELIYNKYITMEEADAVAATARASRQTIHEALKIPVKMKFKLTRLVRSNMKYGQYKCNSCPRRVRTYCKCSPGVIRCNECYAKHILDIHIEV
jgi:hypothetical protein